MIATWYQKQICISILGVGMGRFKLISTGLWFFLLFPGLVYAESSKDTDRLLKKVEELKKEVNRLNKRVEKLEESDQILNWATMPPVIEEEQESPKFQEWEMIHPLRPYGEKRKWKPPLHYHSPGRYCPISKRVIGMDEEPPDMTLFKPGVALGGKEAVPDFDENRVDNRVQFSIGAGITNHIVTFLEGQWKYQWGIDEGEEANSLDLYQGFIGYNRIVDLPWDLTVGRQELFYGSGYIFGANVFGNGETFDLIKLDYSAGKHFRTDFLASKLAEHKDEEEGLDKDLFGFYSTIVPTEGILLDFFGFVTVDENNVFGESVQKQGRETRYMVGSRISVDLGKYIGIELEPIFEFGRQLNTVRDSNDQIRAYGGHADVNISLPVSWNPKMVFSYSHATGDVDLSDNRSQEFQGTTFHDSFIFGDLGLIRDASGVTLGDNNDRFSGIRVLTGGISLKPIYFFRLNLDYHDFTSQRAPKGMANHIGSEGNYILSFELPEDINLLLGFNQFYPASGYNQAVESSKTINYYYLQTKVSF
jgi:hypothetical protein